MNDPNNPPTRVERMESLAARLGAMRKELARLEYEAKLNRSSLEDRYALIIPETGWPGTNKEARDAAEKTAKVQDDIAQKIRATIDHLEKQIAMLKAEIAGLEDERRMHEWVISDKMADALEERVRGSKTVMTNLAIQLGEIAELREQLATYVGVDWGAEGGDKTTYHISAELEDADEESELFGTGETKSEQIPWYPDDADPIDDIPF